MIRTIIATLVLFVGLVVSTVVPTVVSSPIYAQQASTCSTRPPGDNSNACASTAFVQNAVSSLVNTICTAAPSSCTRLFGYANLVWYGNSSTCNGVVDDTSTFVAAENALVGLGGGQLRLPLNATCQISGVRQASVPITYEGGGMGGTAGSGGIPAQANLTRIKWIGAGSAQMFDFLKVNGGAGLRDVWLDGNSLATPLVIDSSVNGDYKNVFVNGCSSFCVVFAATQGTNSWNDIENLSIEATSNGHSALWLTGSTSNTAHNTFRGVKIVHGGTRPAIYLDYNDNNRFFQTFIFRNPGGSGAGVQIDPSVSAGFPVENTFVGLETGAGGWVQPNTTTVSPATIYDLFQSPAPTTNGTPLNYYTSLVGQYSGALTVYNGYTGSIANPTPPINLGSFTQSSTACVSHFSLNGSYGFGVSSNQLNFCAGSTAGFGWWTNGANISGTPQMKLWSSGGLSLGTASDPGAGAFTTTSAIVAGSSLTATTNVIVNGGIVRVQGQATPQVNFTSTNTAQVAQFYSDGTTWAIATQSVGDWLHVTLSNGQFAVLAVTDSTTSTTGAQTIAGGLGVAKNVNVGGSLGVTGSGTFGTFMKVTPTLVNSLPTCNSGNDGIQAFVTNNATATAFGGAVTTGGTNHHPVYCDGSASAWKQG